jgi:uncharacterized phage protein (TIGR01671 family)
MQYKYRGKRKDNGEWAYGCLVSTSPDEAFILIGVTGHIKRDDYECYMVEVLPETVGMWTGLEDNNKKEIYGGDILKSFSPTVPAYEVFYCKSSYRLRYYMKCGELYDWGPLFRMDEIRQEGRLKMYPEVIGNIHDNPELLTPLKGERLNTMNNLDPNAATQQAEEVKSEGQEQTNDAVQATEQEAQENAMESAEEGTTEG